MTSIQMQAAFQREWDQLENVPEFNSTDILYWLNQGVQRFITDKFTGFYHRGLSVEQTQDIIEDLYTLVREELLTGAAITVGIDIPNSYIIDLTSLSSNYRRKLAEEVVISFTDALGNSITKRQGITECTSDRYRAKIDDPFSEHKLHYNEAKPLRLFSNNVVELITDGNYSITSYYIKYIKEPAVITNTVSCDLPLHTHLIIVKLAIDAALENLGNPRYQTHSIETKTIE